MASPSPLSIDQMIRKTCVNTHDLARRDVQQALQSSSAKLELKLTSYFYDDGESKELLCLAGTITYQHRGSRSQVPIEIWLQEDHPLISPFAYVKPTGEMDISTNSPDVDRSGSIVLPYLKLWSYPDSDLKNFLAALSTAFSHCPPICTRPSASSYPQSPTEIDGVLRDSLQTAVLDKIRARLKDVTQFSRVQIDSLRKTEQDLNDGYFKLQSFIQNMQQQQTQAQDSLSNLQTKIGQLTESRRRLAPSTLPNNQTIKDDAILTPAPVYKQLLQCYTEEHAIQDLLFYLADGLKRESIGLDVYLRHVRDLSRRQFVLRATMQKCRQVAGLRVR